MTTQHRLAADFANLLAARKFVTGRTPASGVDAERQRSARWIEHLATPVTARVEYHDGVRSFYPQQSERGAVSGEIFYLHGGGLVHYSTEVFAPFLSLLCEATGRVVRAFDYPKAPETAMHDIVASLDARLARALAQTDSVELVGDSVGGLLALYFASRRFRTKISRLQLLYPVLASHQDYPSFIQYGSGFLLDAQTLAEFAAHWLPWMREQGFEPLADDFDFNALPPCVLHTAGCDVLCDEGLAFERRARAAQAPLRHLHQPNLPHDFCLYAGKLASARQGVDALIQSLNSDPWHHDRQ